jgi:hypothetical protein
MDTNVDICDEQGPDTAGNRVWPAQEPGDEAGPMLDMPAVVVAQVQTYSGREPDRWSWLDWLEPFGTLLELLGQLCC